MIKVTLEFYTVPETIIALNAIMNLPDVKISNPEADSKRKGRNDKGKARGDYKPRTAGGGPTPPSVVATPQPAAPEKGSGTQSQEASANAGTLPVTPAAADLSPAATVLAEVQTQQRAHAVTIGEKDTQAQKAVEKLNEAKGLDAVRVLLAQFGVNRVREIPTARRTEFLEQAAQASV